MSRSVVRRASLACALALTMCMGSCATNHVLNWSVGEPSMYKQNPDHRQRAFLNPGGTLIALPRHVSPVCEMSSNLYRKPGENNQ